MIGRPPSPPLFPYPTLSRSYSAIESGMPLPLSTSVSFARRAIPAPRRAPAEPSEFRQPACALAALLFPHGHALPEPPASRCARSEEHTSELQSHLNLVCRLL